MAPKKRPVKKTGHSRTAKAKAAEVEKVTKPEPRERDEFGFLEGTDSSITAQVLAEGGFSRPALYAVIEERIANQAGNTDDALVTRNGTQKNIPNLVATVVSSMKKRGYVIESTWKMVKDENWVEPTEEEKPAKKAASKKSTKAPGKKTTRKVRTSKKS